MADSALKSIGGSSPRDDPLVQQSEIDDTRRTSSLVLDEDAFHRLTWSLSLGARYVPDTDADADAIDKC